MDRYRRQFSSCPPVEDDLPRLPGDHRFKALFKILVREAMSDDRRDVHARLQHHGHLVPRLVHLASVDTLDSKHIEDQGTPIHRHLRSRDAQHGNLATVTHVGDHVAQGLRTARHLQGYIESFHHPQLLLHFRNRCLFWIHSHSCAQLARQIQPEGIHIGHNNMPCPRMTYHRNRHHADRTRARNEDILAEHGEREGSMHRVPERIEDGGDLLIDIVSMSPDIGHGQRNKFREGARSIHAHTKRVRAEMPSPGQAVAAPSTNDMAFAADNVAGIEVINIRSDFDNFPDKFVPNRHGDWNRLLRPIVPLINMDVRSADAGVSDTDQDIIDTDVGFRYLFKPEPRLRLTFHKCLQY